MAAMRTLVPGSVATSHDFGDITNTISMSSCHICRSWSTALPCKLQSGGWCWWLSRGIWWGEAEERRFTLACHQGFHSHSCTQKSMLNSPCTLCFYCHSLSTTNGCDYHCVNVPQTQNNIARVPLKSMWQAWGCVFFSNTELAEMSFEFLHLRIIVFTVVVCISGIPLSSWESVYLSTTFSGHHKISEYLLLTALSRLSSSPLLHTTSAPCWCGVGLQHSEQYSGQINDL